jgi:hypothetical protein
MIGLRTITGGTNEVYRDKIERALRHLAPRATHASLGTLRATTPDHRRRQFSDRQWILATSLLTLGEGRPQLLT